MAESAEYRRQTESTTFIETSGGLLTEQLVRKVRERECGESAVDPGTFAGPDEDPVTEAALEDEIGQTWEDLRERWDEVSQDNEIFGMDVSAARERWILKLLEGLEFEPSYIQSNLDADGVSAKLSHYGWPPPEEVSTFGEMDGAIPPIIHTVQPGSSGPESPDIELDEGNHPGAAGRQRSPHDELQTYLNASDEQLWGIVTDGLKLRILRDYYHTYTRGYVEFDLENIFTNRNYGDFRALYRLAHASRFIPREIDEEEEAETPLEQLYQVALSTGVKVGQGLQSNVVSAIETLGNGFLNEEIHEALATDSQEATEDYYQDVLFVIYRLLFLLFAEQRGMMSARDSLYMDEYSITKLRERAERRDFGDRNSDLWEGLKGTFALVGQGDEDLDIPGYNGGLFDDENLEYILESECPNDKLLQAVDDLTHVEQEGYRQRISYADLGVEEIGAVYESLLEFTPQLAETVIDLESRDEPIPAGSFYLDDRGIERKETGSYYTDPDLVDELIHSALKPVVEDRVDNDASPGNQEEQLLSITVCDPAVGSGAFLIAANNFLANRLAKIRSGSEYPSEETVRECRRSVVQHCIYGVDLNPMAVELAKVSLWINSAVADKPLSFLDHRIKQGNSLLGTTPELISKGVPEDAYETSRGRDWHHGNEVRKRVRNENKGVQTGLDWDWDEQDEYVSLAEQLDDIEEDGINDILEKERLFSELQKSEELQREQLVLDVWTAAFYWPLDGSIDEYPTPKTIERLRREPPESSDLPAEELSGLQAVRTFATKVSEERSFFHWPLEFPAVYSNRGGFDCILGNPPWDTLELRESEFFAVSKPEIASVENSSKRQKLIQELENTDPPTYRSYEDAKNAIESMTKFIKNSGRFPLSSYGVINTYAPFAEFGLTNITSYGRSGIITPTAIATGSDTQAFFQKLIDDKRLSHLYDFENKLGLFPAVHREYKFCLLTMVGKSRRQETFSLAFYLLRKDDLKDEGRNIVLSADDISLINPNTKTLPVFRTQRDAQLTIDIYQETGVLKSEAEDGNPWELELTRILHTSDDSNLFYTKEDLTSENYTLDGNKFIGEDQDFLPLYESKLTYQYDHRYASFAEVEDAASSGKPLPVNGEEKDDRNFRVFPRYWVKKDVALERDNALWNIGLRDITNPNNKRTVICSAIPQAPTLHSFNLMKNISANDGLLLMAFLNSFPVDFAARQKMSSFRLGQYMVRQLPIPSPNKLAEIQLEGSPISDRISNLAFQLVFTSDDLLEFASETRFDQGPFKFSSPNGVPREKIRYKLEGMILHVYGIAEEDINYLFQEFEKVRKNDLENFGYYRTREEIKKWYKKFEARIDH